MSESLEQRLARALQESISQDEAQKRQQERREQYEKLSTAASARMPQLPPPPASFDDQVFSQIQNALQATPGPQSLPPIPNRSYRALGAQSLTDSGDSSSQTPSFGMGADASTAEMLNAVQTALMGASSTIGSTALSSQAGSTGILPPRPGRRGRPPVEMTEEAKERIREDNRARKRRWRVSHTSRNRDNDLRSRILRRANQLYGEAASQVKSSWIEEEFKNRRERRSPRRMGALMGLSDEDDSDESADSSNSPSAAAAQNAARSLTKQSRAAAGDRLTRLFRQSNSLLQAAVQPGQKSNMPSHLAPHLVVLSPSRPSFRVRRQDQAAAWQPRRYAVRGELCLGVPPNIASIAKELGEARGKSAEAPESFREHTVKSEPSETPQIA